MKVKLCFNSILTASLTLLNCEAVRGSDRDELLSLLTSTQHERGEVHAIYVDRVGRERVLVGFDFGTGAWYKAFSTYAGGVDTQGLPFEGRPALGQVKLITDEPPRQFDTALEEHFPFVITRDFVRRPELMKAVEKVGDLYRVTMTTPRGVRWLESLPAGFDVADKTVIFWIDGRGLVVKADNYSGLEGQPWVWNYDTPESVKWGVADSVNAGIRSRVDLRTTNASDPARFSMQQVERMAVDAFLIADRQPLWFGKSVDAIVKSARAKRGGPQEYVPPVSPGVSASGSTSGTSTGKPAPIPVPILDPRPVDRYRTYLTLAGISLLALAAVAWWRRQHAA